MVAGLRALLWPLDTPDRRQRTATTRITRKSAWWPVSTTRSGAGGSGPRHRTRQVWEPLRWTSLTEWASLLVEVCDSDTRPVVMALLPHLHVSSRRCW